MVDTVNSKETGTIPASRILTFLWRLTCRSSTVLLNDKTINTRVFFAMHSCLARSEVLLHPIIQQVRFQSL